MTGDTRTALLSALASEAEPGAAELCDVLGDVLRGPNGDGPVAVDRLRARVYRLRLGSNGGSHSFMLRLFDPWLAWRNQLVVRRWLPALGLGDRCARLVATAADRGGRWVWHVYDDLGEAPVNPASQDTTQAAMVMELLAELHIRAARHALVPECRHYCGSLGAAYLTANVRDAITVLEELSPPRLDPTLEQCALRDGLLARLYRLQEELPRRLRLLETLGGPDTLLHGDLWTDNAFVMPGPEGPVARFIGWDHAAVGPVSYDLSTFLYRFPRSERPWILEAYRCKAAREDWYLPTARDLNALFETAEYARYANRVIWPAVALLEQGAPWGFQRLAQVERWFDGLQPALPLN